MATLDPSIDPATAALLNTFIQALNDGRAVNSLMVASYTCLIYDIFLMFPIELEYVWKTKITIGSVMYVVMRYGNILEQAITLIYFLHPDMPFEFCRIWFYFDEWFAYGLFIPTTIFIGLRTYALYRNDGPFYKWLIICLIGGTNIGMFISLGLITRQIKFAPPQISGLTCGFTIASAPHNATLFQFVVSASFDFSLFCLTAARLFQHFQMGNYRLTKIIFRDTLAYDSVLFFTGLSTLLLYSVKIPTEREQLRALLIAPMKSMAVIISSRMVLNLRRMIIAPQALNVNTLAIGPEMDKTSFSMPSMAFRPGIEDDV
ncbi:hypothetical protein D9615_002740 [Tricholomella constricta]|uniref:DUF6533 domain-containing protein n=1 Tax=Tricholomella constricta TaxID=117010 RepID=A0A8H5M6L5_9AGAR|nr:hypothetical protein D9615_002740 [Tricholomella constricta]